MYKVKLSNNACKNLDKIPKNYYLKIYSKLKKLSEVPRPNGSLKLADSEVYRIRVGVYRIIYEINDKESIIEVYDVIHRKDAYRKN